MTILTFEDGSLGVRFTPEELYIVSTFFTAIQALLIMGEKSVKEKDELFSREIQ